MMVLDKPIIAALLAFIIKTCAYLVLAWTLLKPWTQGRVASVAKLVGLKLGLGAMGIGAAWLLALESSGPLLLLTLSVTRLLEWTILLNRFERGLTVRPSLQLKTIAIFLSTLTTILLDAPVILGAFAIIGFC